MTGTMDNGGAKPMGTMDGGGAKPGDATSTGGMQANGGGPEPHQGSNPGAQSDPGPKEVGFYDTAGDHMGGDDGVQNATERPSPMRMGGVDGSQPNAGQRGGQNTGTSGSQTTSKVGWKMAGTARSRAASYSSEEEYGAGSVGVADTHEPGHTGTGASSGAYQSRAAERLATANGGTGATGGRMDEPVEDFDSTPAARAGEMAEGAGALAQGFFAKAKDAVEDFLDADMDGDGNVGAKRAQAGSETYGTGGTAQSTDDWDQSDSGWDDSATGTSYERDTPGTRPYNAAAARAAAPQRERELTAA